MQPTTPALVSAVVKKPSARIINSFCRREMLKRLQGLHTGGLRLHDVESGRSHQFGDRHEAVAITVSNPDFYRAVALEGDIGAGRAWAEGWWHTTDLKQALRTLINNDDLFESSGGVAGYVSSQYHRFKHYGRRNTEANAKRNIAAHYDLGNDFYNQWLDSRMLYSSGIYLNKNDSLETAQLEKIDRICRKLQLQPGQHVLEIGSGWGGFAIHAARQYDVRVTTITISQAQYDYCCAKVAEYGLQEKVKPLLLDYRKLQGQYDAVVSIEMIEAVGHEYLDSYFAVINRVLKPDGKALVQAITAHDQNYAAYLAKSDFIREYIFPGGSLPSIGAMVSSSSKTGDMQVTHLEDIAWHYSKTLDDWFKRLNENKANLPEVNQNPWFLRLWQFYLECCSALFSERRIGTVQMMLAKQGNAQATPLNLEQPAAN